MLAHTKVGSKTIPSSGLFYGELSQCESLDVRYAHTLSCGKFAGEIYHTPCFESEDGVLIRPIKVKEITHTEFSLLQSSFLSVFNEESLSSLNESNVIEYLNHTQKLSVAV